VSFEYAPGFSNLPTIVTATVVRTDEAGDVTSHSDPHYPYHFSQEIIGHSE
jgi:hypothetical protein